MNLKTLAIRLAFVVSASFMMSTVSAAVINGSDFTAGQTTQDVGGFNWTILPAGSTFQKKTMGGFTGVGISGNTQDEIDIREFLTGTALNANLYNIYSITLGVLFDGPEFGDVNEVAEVTVKSLSGGIISYTLTATGANTAVWSGIDGTVSNLSPAVDGRGAVWNVLNPFGNLGDISSISFTALAGVCGSAGGACNNQSDFTLVGMETVKVPEPASLALLGLGLVGLAATRRRKA